MKKTIKRNAAIRLFQTIGAMALGHLDEKTLEAVMANFNAFRSVTDDFDKLKKELSDRLYKDVDKEVHQKFFEIVAKFEAETDMEKRNELYEVMKTHTDIYPLYEKHIAVIIALLNKDLEIEIEEVDADDFIKGVVLGKKDAPIHEIRGIFAPIFKEEKKEDKTDFSELDELLKDLKD